MPARCRTVPAGAPLCTDRSMPMTATVAGNLSADCRRIMTERTGDRRKPRVRVIDENGANLFAFMGGQGWHAGSPSVRLHVCTGHRDRIMHYRWNLPTLQSVDRLAYRRPDVGAPITWGFVGLRLSRCRCHWVTGLPPDQRVVLRSDQVSATRHSRPSVRSDRKSTRLNSSHA